MSRDLQEVAHCLLEDRRGGENLEMPCLVQAMTDLTADLVSACEPERSSVVTHARMVRML